MLTWLIISAILVISFAYLIFYLQGVVYINKSKKLPDFSAIRQQEINEEFEAGRISAEEAKQLKQDLTAEVSLTNKQGKSERQANSQSSHFSYQIFAVFIAISFLSALALYQHLGFNNEVVFTEKIKQGEVTQESMTAFLSYRAHKYNRAEDWYWLGKDKVELEDYQAAKDAFEQALLIPSENDEDVLMILVEYAQSIFFANEQQIGDQLEDVITQILAINSAQPTALGLQGIIEFDRQNYQQAILVWQKAIHSGASFTERASLLEGIQRAREIGSISIEQIPSLVSHKIKLTLSVEGVNKLASDALFLVYARTAAQPMPVAIKRIFPAQLNGIIELTNLDNLMPGMSLLDVSKVDVVVKLARQSDQDLTKGKEVGYLRNVVVNSSDVLEIAIKL